MSILTKKLNLSPESGVRKALLILLSFLLPLIVILAALAGLKIAPFGDKTLVISDANGLYINTLAYAGRMFKGLEGLQYSFEKGLGGNMTGHLNGVLLAPFSFLLAFSDIRDYPSAFAFVSALSFSLAGLTMYLFLAGLHGHKGSNLIFSTAYALMGFNVANVFQACFFMAAPVLPLVALGLVWLFRGKSPLLYILSLACGLATSAYFGFVACVASVLFFFTGLWLKKEELEGRKLRLFIHYALSSLFGGLLASVLWLPSFLSLQGGRLDQTGLADFSFGENMPFLEIGAKLFTGANSTGELVNGLPNIFVGILPLALALLFFLSRAVDRRKKAAAGFLLGFYLLSFWFVALNMLMHGGTVTNWFNYRYSYVFSFLLLCIAAELWEKLEEVPFGEMKRCLVYMLLAAAVIFSKQYEFLKGGALILDFVLLLLVFLAWRMHVKRPEVNKRVLFDVIALILMCVNLFCNYYFCTKSILEWGITLSDYRKTVEQVAPLVQAVRPQGTDLYRMEVNKQRSETCGNDPMLYGYYGVGHGGSNERDFVRRGLNKLGVPWFDMRNYYADGVPAATDDLLGIRYVIAAEDLTEEKGYVNVTNFEQATAVFGEQEEYTDLYQNADALSAAILAAGDPEAVETDIADVFANLNAVWAALSGEEEPVFTEEEDILFLARNYSDPGELDAKTAREITAYYDARTSAASASASGSAASSVSLERPEGLVPEDAPEYSAYIEYTFTARQDGRVYVYNRSGLSDRSGAAVPAISFLGFYAAGDTVTGYIPISGSYVDRMTMEEVCGRLRVAYANDDTLHALCQAVKARPVTLDREKETRLTGTFTAEAGQTLLFTIPWDSGWTLTVDGERAELKEVFGVFMAAEVPAGTHSYVMTYVPKGLKPGLTVSAVTLVLTVLYLVIGRKWIDRLPVRSKPEGEPEDAPLPEGAPSEAAGEPGEEETP